VNIRAWAAGFVAALLTACGGGGGGQSDPPLTATASPASTVLTASTTNIAQPSARVSVLLEGTLTQNVVYVPAGSAKGLVSAVVDATGTIVILGAIPGTLAAGSYTDTLTVNVCYDDQCQHPATAPLTIPVTYNVTQGDPSTAEPIIIDTVPASAAVGSAGFTLALDGINFTPSSVVTWNDQVLPSTYVSVNRLNVAVPTADLASVATAGIMVSNASTGGIASPGLAFQVRSPVPMVSALAPATAGQGGSSFLLTITGAGFDSTSQVTWNGSPRPTGFVSPTRITAQIGADDIAAASAVPVGVYNVDGGSITSNTMTVTVADVPLSLTSLVPAFVTAAGPAYAQIVTGRGFAASSTVQFNGSPRATTFVSTTQIVAQLGAADIAGIGSAAITVVNGGSSPTTSGPLTLTIVAPTTDATAMQINPQHTGAISFASIVGPTELPTSPTWTAPLNGFSGYPLIAGGRVFVTDAGNGGELVALSAATGAVIWGPVFVPGVFAATYDNGRVITVSGNGVMSGFDAASGNTLWSTQLSIEYTFNSAPTAANGIVFVGGMLADGALFAVDDSTGTLLWTAPVLHGDGSSPTVTSDGVYVSYPCQTYDFAPATGATVWQVDGGCDGGGGETGSYVNGVYYSPNSITSTTGQIFSAEAGTLLSDYTGTPALGSSVGYFMQWSGTLEAVDLSSKSVLWTFDGDGTLASLPILVNNYVFVTSSSGKLYALDAVAGTQIWSTTLTANVTAGLQRPEMAAGNGLLLVPVNKSLVAYKLSDNP